MNVVPLAPRTQMIDQKIKVCKHGVSGSVLSYPVKILNQLKTE